MLLADEGPLLKHEVTHRRRGPLYLTLIIMVVMMMVTVVMMMVMVLMMMVIMVMVMVVMIRICGSI